MIAVDLGTIRLFLHVLAATVWVGGQLTLAGLLPALRGLGRDAPASAARQFQRVAWPAFAVLILTGIWNITAESGHLDDGAYRHTLEIKLAVVALSGVAAFAHARSRSRAGLAVWGALTGLSAMGALFLGIVLAG